jgi:hypothetical protein
LFTKCETRTRINMNIKETAVNVFSRRHTPDSPLSHSTLEHEKVAELLRVATSIRDGYEPDNYDSGGRAIVATLPSEYNEHFFSGVAIVEEGEEVLEGFRSRVEGELPRPYREVIRTQKPSAKAVELIFYNSKALALTGSNELPIDDANWELVSINAYPDTNNTFPPIQPYALKANYYGLDGGTPTNYTEEDFLDLLTVSEAYWHNKAMIRVEP